MVRKSSKTDKLLKNLYYDASKPGAFSGVNALHDAAVRRNTNKRIKISKYQVKKFLEAQETYSLHKLPRHHFTHRRVVVSGPFQQWQADLVDMSKFAQENKGYNWILVAIDVFTKKAFAVPVKSKSTPSMLDAFKRLLEDVPENELPHKIQTDKGVEFKCKGVLNFLKMKGIQWFSTEDDTTKACIVERLNRTLKEKMYRAFTSQCNNKWLLLLPDLLKGYNSTIHSSIKTTPNDANTDDPDMVSLIRDRLYGPVNRLDKKVKAEINHPTADILAKGDYVRMKKTRMIFSKSYLPNYTTEIFVVNDVINTTPLTYFVKDLKGEGIKGTFYGHELQKVAKPTVFEVEEVLKEDGNRVFVKWVGYGPEFNQWIRRRDLRKYKSS